MRCSNRDDVLHLRFIYNLIEHLWWTFCCQYSKPLSIFTKNRHISHVTKSRIFKNLNLSKKADRNFRRTLLKNRFRHLKLYWNPPSWLAESRCHMGTFWKKKDWSSHFWESNLSGFGTWKFTAKEDLDWQKQVFLHSFKPWPAQKPKWPTFLWEKVYIKKFCSVKARGF